MIITLSAFYSIRLIRLCFRKLIELGILTLALIVTLGTIEWYWIYKIVQITFDKFVLKDRLKVKEDKRNSKCMTSELLGKCIELTKKPINYLEGK